MTDRPRGYQTFFADLKRRNVFKVAAVYGAVAFVVMQAADFLVPALRLPDAFATGIALLAILGFPLALVLAWAFELTPEGLRREEGPESGELEAIVAQPVARRWPSGILALLGVVLLAGGVWWTVGPGETGESADEGSGPLASSIAVLPFLNLSADTANEYFSDGVTEEIITALSRLPELRVVSRSATFRYKGEDVDPRAVGRELNVAAILEGSVRKQGDRLRITAQLIDVENGFHIWSENYDRRYEAIFEVQDDVARRIAGALRINLTEGEAATLVRPPTENLEAYELYSRARHEFYKYSPEGNAAAIALYRKALEIDPDYALALAGLSLCQTQNVNAGWSDDAEWLTRAETSARRALEIDPNLAEAHFALGFIHEQRAEFEPMAEAMGRALALNPNHAHAHDSQADILWRHRGQMDSALAEYEVALRLDPFLVPAHLNRAMVLVLKGQFMEANRRLEWVVRENADVALVHVFHGAVGLLQGRYADATASYRAAIALVPNHVEARIGLAAALLDSGDTGSAANEADRLSAVDAQGSFVRAGRDYVLGRIDLVRGDAGAAIERLRRATELAPHVRYTGVSFWGALVKAYLEVGQPTEALQVLETALEVEPYYVPHLYWFGRAQEMEGDEEGAVEAYRRFLDAWRDADADAPFLDDARARLSALSSRRS